MDGRSGKANGIKAKEDKARAWEGDLKGMKWKRMEENGIEGVHRR